MPDAYTNRFVGFVDILGFEELVRVADTSAERRHEIIEALRTVRGVNPPADSDTDLQIQNFSDSLIISARESAEGLWHLLLSLNALTWNLMQLGVLVRGAISFGGMHHDDEIVFGVAINEAYRLETTIARYPRIVLGRSAYDASRRFASEASEWELNYSSRLIRDEDGVMFLHFLHDLAVANENATVGSASSPFLERGTAVHGMLQRKLDEPVDAPHVYEKFKWLGRYWNRVFDAGPMMNMFRLLGPISLPGVVPARGDD